jgi:hypothetical protein
MCTIWGRGRVEFASPRLIASAQPGNRDQPRRAKMRTLMKVKIPTAAGNEAIKNGSLPEIFGKALASLNAEAAYFTSEDGIRTGLIFFDMTDSSDIPSAAEPFYMAFDAQISFEPVMNADDMAAGVGKAMEAA